MTDLRARTIAITGASSGIGAATAIACADAGMHVALGARRRDRLEEIASKIHGRGGRVSVFDVDVTDAERCRAFVEAAAVEFGGLSAVFANAGIGEEGALMRMTDRAIRDMFEINVFGSLNVIRPAVEIMRRAGAGHVLWCSSCLSVRPVPMYSAYTASKSAQHHFAAAMRTELRDAGIHVSSVHPVGTQTEFFEQSRSRSVAPTRPSRSRRLQSPARVADAVVRCLRKPRPEVWTSQGARLSFIASLFAPRLADAYFRRVIRGRVSDQDSDTSSATA